MDRYWLGHRNRLRQRAEEAGLEALRPHELVELVLFYAVPRADVAETARALIGALGSPQAVFRASREALMSVPGVTRSMAEWLVMTGELVDAYAAVDREKLPGINRPRDVMEFLSGRWRSVPAPQSWMIYADYDNRLMTYTVICDSLHWEGAEHTHRIVEEALAMQARRAILVLFVGTEPLEMEEDELARLVAFARTLRAIEVELMDCVLVGEQGMRSLNADGCLGSVRQETSRPDLHERYCNGG